MPSFPSIHRFRNNDRPSLGAKLALDDGADVPLVVVQCVPNKRKHGCRRPNRLERMLRLFSAGEEFPPEFALISTPARSWGSEDGHDPSPILDPPTCDRRKNQARQMNS
jgi:hypothetical protein